MQAFRRPGSIPSITATVPYPRPHLESNREVEFISQGKIYANVHFGIIEKKLGKVKGDSEKVSKSNRVVAL